MSIFCRRGNQGIPSESEVQRNFSWMDHKIMIIICEEIRRGFTLRNARLPPPSRVLSVAAMIYGWLNLQGPALFETQQWQSLFAFVSRGKISHGENIAPRRWYRLSRRSSHLLRLGAEDKSTRANFVYTDACSGTRMSVYIRGRRKETLKWNIRPS